VPEAGQVKTETAAPIRPGTGAEALFLRLKALRREIADENSVPPYMIFPDRTLRELAAARPSDMTGLGAVFGVGEFKREKYGQVFLEEILREEAGA
jgi:ATP-dependent DNA helicase RecQ